MKVYMLFAILPNAVSCYSDVRRNDRRKNDSVLKSKSSTSYLMLLLFILQRIILSKPLLRLRGAGARTP